MPSTIDIDGTLDWYTAQVTLDGIEYLLELAWNTRSSQWYLSMSKSDGTALVSGVPIVVDYPLLRHTVGPDIPKGYLMAVDTSGNGEEIAEQEDLGVKVLLMYFTEAEIDELEDAA